MYVFLLFLLSKSSVYRALWKKKTSVLLFSRLQVPLPNIHKHGGVIGRLDIDRFLALDGVGQFTSFAARNSHTTIGWSYRESGIQ